MGILNNFIKKAPNFIIGSLFLLSCHPDSHSTGQYKISIDTIQLKDNVDYLYDYEAIIEGVYYIPADTDKMYMATLKDRETIALLNFKDISDSSFTHLDFKANTIVACDSNVYVFADDTSLVQRFVLSDGILVAKEVRQLPSIDIEGFFISSNIHTPIEVIGNFDFLVPYRVKRKFINKNMVDTFAYIRLKMSGEATGSYYKLIEYPPRYLKEFEFYRNPILGSDKKINTIYYTFQSGTMLRALDFNGEVKRQVELQDFKGAKFKSSAKSDFTYLRSYMSASDVYTKIFCDEHGNVWLIKNNRKANPYRSSIYCYDNTLKELQSVNLKTELNTEISFIKKNKLYIYVSHSGNRFITCTLVSEL